MIRLDDVAFGYPDAAPVLSGVDLELHDAELLAVAGPTGSGKSTLLRVLNGLVPHLTGGRLTGRVSVEGRDVTGRPPRELAHLVGYVGQDPVAGFVTDTVEEELAYGMEQLGLAPATMRRRVEETLDLLGLADLRGRDLVSLSGGQQQRVAIGSVLTVHPRVLVLDEPTSALDPTAAEEVLATLARLVDDVGVSVVLAEHRLERVLPFADRLAWIADGRLLVGDPREILSRPEVVAAGSAPPLVHLGRAAGWDPLPLSVREARRAARDLRSLQPAALSADLGPRAGEAPVAVVERLDVRHGDITALERVSLRLSGGEVTALMGRNGAGKSTLLWSLQGSGPRHGGRATVDGIDTATVKPGRRRELVGLVPQTASDLLYLETVGAECASADTVLGLTPGTTARLLHRLVPGIPAERHPRDLSEGQQLALVLALVLADRPRTLLLDEPTRGLDYAAKERLAVVLAELAAEGMAVLVSTHDVEFVAQVADRVVVLAEGSVISAGPTVQVVTETPAFSPQVTKVLGPPWLTPAQVRASLAGVAP
ncbi:ATP-binding cassette domain-containing protein [Nocardioidaceae bacterium]|nr:ATP-binding cassette domain-containing protein [Nocardioidaceae bacterium]